MQCKGMRMCYISLKAVGLSVKAHPPSPPFHYQPPNGEMWLIGNLAPMTLSEGHQRTRLPREYSKLVLLPLFLDTLLPLHITSVGHSVTRSEFQTNIALRPADFLVIDSLIPCRMVMISKSYQSLGIGMARPRGLGICVCNIHLRLYLIRFWKWF